MVFSAQNACGDSGKVTFNGEGVNQTAPFTFPAGPDPMLTLPETVGEFGTATVTIVILAPDGETVVGILQVTVDTADDGGPQTCTEMPLPSH
jgi:hypothetical protein